MYARERPVLPFEDPTELLYLRVGIDDFVEEQLAPAAVRVPGQSVNRGSLSEPEDVLFHEEGRYDGLGVVEFSVKDIPQAIVSDQGPGAIFFMRHRPLEDNYSHSEICCDKILPCEGDFEPSKSVKLKFRTDLCKRILTTRIKISAARSRR